ncbi:hypothetical protein [Psychrobacter sp. WY6]|nr:hypothetical protein [Psychrobacter sp. WY6]
MTALKNITGVTAIELDPDNNVATIRYEETHQYPCVYARQSVRSIM